MNTRHLSSHFWEQTSYWALWINAISAVLGGWYLLGGAGDMSLSYLRDTPFESFAGPGFILLFIVGGSSLLAAVARWRRAPFAFPLTLAAGAILLGWLLVEFVWIPEGWAFQFVFAVVAAAIMAGGYLGWTNSVRRTQ